MLFTYARKLRKDQTNAEQILWKILRNRKFLRYKFRRQYPIPPYIIDFYCHECHLAIEIDGGQHAEESEQERDLVRENFLKEKGITILRYWNFEILQQLESVLESIYQVLAQSKLEENK